MKKKAILKRLEEIVAYINNISTSNVFNNIVNDINDELCDIINNIKAGYTPREFLSFRVALNKLLDGDAKKITNNDNTYCSFNCNRLAWFHNNGNFKSYDVNVLSKLPWWVVE